MSEWGGRWCFISRPVTLHSGESAIVTNEQGHKLLARGTTVPTDATAGFATGCLFIHTDGNDGDAVYINDGTATSCDFNAILSSAAGQGAAITAGVTQLVQLNTTTGTDFTISTLITTGWGFSLAAEAEAFVGVVVNCQTRLAQIEARLEAAGIIATN